MANEKKANEKNERVGIVGVGRMGLAMLRHLVKKGYTVTACDVSAEALKNRAARLVRLRLIHRRARQAVRLRDPRARLHGRSRGRGLWPGRLARQSCVGSIIAVSSTTSPYYGAGDRQGRRPESIGVARRTDLPRRASRPTRARCWHWSAASPTSCARRAVYGSFCSDYAHLGDVGHGQVGKTMNNLLLWISASG